MALEEAGRRKFAELVSDHVFSDIDGYKLLAIVYVEIQADKIRRYHRTARPSLNRLVRVRLLRLVDFVLKTWIDKRTFFN